MLSFVEENFYTKFNVKFIAGVDEVGRGCGAGPVVAASVIMPPKSRIDGINDSKKINPRKREILYEQIKSRALAVGIGVVDNLIIDEINILEATKIAMKQAVEACFSNLKNIKKSTLILIDGNFIIGYQNFSYNELALVKGDTRSYNIASASIIAKVFRDRIMRLYDTVFPEYEFSRHKGYLTALHRKLIIKHGPSAIHRKSFLKKLLMNTDEHR